MVRIEVVVLGIGLMLVAYAIGYLVGYRHCFNYIREEFRRHREEINL